MAKSDKCPYCEKNPDVLNKAEGYAVMWPEVEKDYQKFIKSGVDPDLALTRAINNWIVWVTGSWICKMKSRQLIIRKFWEFYRRSPGSDTGNKIEWTTKELCKYFQKKYPEAWKCFCGEDYKRKISGAGHG